MSHFIARNPRVASIVGRRNESARTTVASYETIRAFLELFERTRIELGIQYDDIRNVVEALEGGGMAGKKADPASPTSRYTTRNHCRGDELLAICLNLCF